jgi:nucleotide-binding universal stress UspA family protein
MTIASILTMLDGVEGDVIDLEAASHLAAAFHCHSDLLHVRRDGLSGMPMIGEAMTADLINIVQAQVEKEEQVRANRCQATFDQWTQAHKTESASLIDVTGSIGTLVARYGRLADMVVLPAPSLSDGNLSAAAEAAIYRTGRPVLFSPRQELKTLGKRVSVFWNDSPEASRAVKAAMPFLQQAKAVQISGVDDGSFDTSTVHDLASSLSRHGVIAEECLLASDHRTAGEALLDGAWDFDADLIVMGAFGHSRLRELILGGVTQHILHVAGRPVLMMH